MRPIPVAILMLLAAAPAVPADEELVRLEVGETKPGFGTVRPICDAPSVAVIAAGVLRAVGPGETRCSVATVQAQGTRRLYRVVVTRPDPSKGTTGGASGPR